jgi:uncharacterized protein (TIGR03083 family)
VKGRAGADPGVPVADSGPMDAATADHYIRAVEREGGRLLDAASVDPAAPVEACPGWDVTRLVVHVGQVHRYMAAVLRAASLDPPTHRFERPADDEDPLDWARASLGIVVDALRVTDPATPCWNWGPDDEAGFFHRRMAMETLVHRVDAEDAVGRPTDVDSDLATDGVDEYLTVALQASPRPDVAFTFPEGSLHLHRTDGPGEWLVEADGGRVTIAREHRKGAVAVRGSGPDLLRWVWKRPGAEVEVLGDADLGEAWRHTAG